MTPPTDGDTSAYRVNEEAQEQNLGPAEIETRLRDTRIWHWLAAVPEHR
jgi:hypothetical protein